MKKFLSKTGLSMSQAQSISNICYQRCLEIDNIVNNINNVSKTVKIDGQDYIETQANEIPDNIIPLIYQKSRFSAVQAFLMEAIKSKSSLLDEIKCYSFASKLDKPEMDSIDRPDMLNQVNEDWGWGQLSDREYSEYIENEAYASHIGQFIHKGGKLSKLREELPKIKLLEWISVEDGKRVPMNVILHHTPTQLMAIHEDLASQHRKYEQKVNYYKAKVKNLVATENARIGKDNANRLGEYQKLKNKAEEEYKLAMDKYRTMYEIELREFNASKEREQAEVATLRINVDRRFQPVINDILKTIEVDMVEAEA